MEGHAELNNILFGDIKLQGRALKKRKGMMGRKMQAVVISARGGGGEGEGRRALKTFRIRAMLFTKVGCQ